MDKTHRTDSSLARAARAGDFGARQLLGERLAVLPTILRRARLAGRLSAHEFEDASQDALLALWRKLDAFDGRSPLLHWAYGFAVLEMRRAMERRGCQREATIDGLSIATAEVSTPVDSERLQREVSGLDDGEQAVVRLRHFEMLTFDEIATRLGIRTSTVKTRYYRALDRLRHRLTRR